MRAAAAELATFTAPLTARTGRVAAGAVAGRGGDLVDLDRTLAGRVIRTGRPVLIGADAAGSDTGTLDDLLDDLPDGVGAVIGVPVPGPDRSVRGALVVARARDRAAFTVNDRDRLPGYAEHAGGALDLDRAREDH